MDAREKEWEKTRANDVKLLSTIVTLAMAYFFGIVGMLFAFSAIPSAHALRVLGVAYIAIVIYICISIWSKPARKILKKPFLVGGIIAAVLFIGFFAYDVTYIANIPTVEEGNYAINLNNYQAFKGKKVATLNEPSTFSMDDKLPIIDCATALYPVVSAFVQATYPEGEYNHTKYSIDSDIIVYCSGTSSAYNALIAGKVDIIFVAAPSEDQLMQAEAEGVELTFTPIGKEAFVFFVNNKNPVENLKVEQIQGIYSGIIKNWNELGGENSSIKAFQRNENSGSQTALIQIMEDKPLMLAPTEEVVGFMDGIFETIADYRNFKNAIGFSFHFYSTEMVKSDKIHLLKIDDIYPDKNSIRNEDYPFTSNFYAVTAGTDNPNIEGFLEWILSTQGQYLIEETGYVSMN